jgi:heat shock protein 4
MNADEAVARGTALQSAILSPRFKVLPYDIVEAQPYPVTVSWAGEEAAGMECDGEGASPTDSVVMFDRGLTFPIVRRVTLRKSGTFVVKSVYDESSVQKYGLPAGAPRDLAEFTIHAPPAEGGEERKVRVNVKNDIHGIIQMSSVQMVEEVMEEETAEEKPKEGEEGKEPEKKKKVKKTNLEFSTARRMDWTEEEINKAYEAEVSMANTDRIVREKADMRNHLESYIYDMRDKVSSDSQLGQYGTEEEKAAFNSANEAMENWLYEDGFDATKTVYAEKLAELQKLGGPLERRQQEAAARPGAVQTLRSTLELYQNWVNTESSDEMYAHITEEELEKVRKCTDEVSAWMYDMLDKQGGLGLDQDPVLTVRDLTAKTQEVNSACGPIMSKPAPKKKKEETKKEEKPAENNNGEPMEGVEKEGDQGEGEPMEAEAEAEKTE